MEKARRGLIARGLREPLVHFAWLAALLIWLTPRPADQRTIDLSAAQLSSLTRQFELKAKRPPSEAERAHLINEYLKEEVLRREAIALGLHQTDPVIKRRLIQSLEYLAETAPDGASSPSEGELRAELEAHSERYRVAEQLDFVQVFVRSGPDLDARAKAVAAKLARISASEGELREGGGEAHRSGAATPAAHLQVGDAFLDGSRFNAKSEQQVAARFGAPLAEALFAQSRKAEAPGKWLGPFTSRYGRHWIWVLAYRPARTKRVTKARRELEATLLERRREAQHDAFLRKAAAGYRIRVAGQPWDVVSERREP